MRHAGILHHGSCRTSSWHHVWAAREAGTVRSHGELWLIVHHVLVGSRALAMKVLRGWWGAIEGWTSSVGKAIVAGVHG